MKTSLTLGKDAKIIVPDRKALESTGSRTQEHGAGSGQRISVPYFCFLFPADYEAYRSEPAAHDSSGCL